MIVKNGWGFSMVALETANTTGGVEYDTQKQSKYVGVANMQTWV